MHPLPALSPYHGWGCYSKYSTAVSDRCALPAERFATDMSDLGARGTG
jgi:hypothetical protein